MLIDRDMKKKDLQAAAGISSASVTKLAKNENVNTEVLQKICAALNCDIGDIMENAEFYIDPKKYYGQGKIVDFEDIRVPVPENYDHYLKKLYGNYMQLPDKSKRKPSHSIRILDLKNPYTKYITKKK